jgi:hypothetical protein
MYKDLSIKISQFLQLLELVKSKLLVHDTAKFFNDNVVGLYFIPWYAIIVPFSVSYHL